MTTEEMKRLRKNLLILKAQGKDVGHIFTAEDILSLSGDVLFLFDLVDRLQKQNDIMKQALTNLCDEICFDSSSGKSWSYYQIDDEAVANARQALKEVEEL